MTKRHRNAFRVLQYQRGAVRNHERRLHPRYLFCLSYVSMNTTLVQYRTDEIGIRRPLGIWACIVFPEDRNTEGAEKEGSRVVLYV